MPDFKITFILFSYNHERFLPDALQSLTRQTMQPDEVILYDDGSQDRSPQILTEFARRLPKSQSVKLLLSEKNHGISHAVNQAFAAATGELWVMLACDDISREDKIERVVEAYEASGRKARSIWSNAEVIDATGKKEGLYFPKNHRESSRLEVLAAGNNGVLGSTQTLHRQVWDVFGGLPPGVYQEDVVLPFRAALLGKVVYIDEPLIYYRYHGANVHFAGSKPREAKAYVLSRIQLEGRFRNIIAIARGRMADVQLAVASGHLTNDRAKKLRLICERNLRDAEIEQVIGLAERRRIPGLIGRAFLKGVPFPRCVRMALFYLYPASYAMVLKLWIRLGQLKLRLFSFSGTDF